jgi:hypothetical protein
MTTGAKSPLISPPAAREPIVAPGGRYYRRTRYFITVVLLFYGGWCIYDGFYNWQEPHWSQAHPDVQPYPPLSIHLNQALGILLPPAALLILLRAVTNSRGECRYENGVVSIPGHPPVPLEKIQAIDRKLWDRKGIAYVEYELPGSPPTKGKFRLDAFVYEGPPTEEIFKIVEDSLLKTAQMPRASKPIAPPPPTGGRLPPRPNLGGK